MFHILYLIGNSILKDGRVTGTLFLPNNQKGPYPTIISMYGGMIKGQVVEERSALLASHGFASLALAFFGAKDLPKNYLDLGTYL